MAYSNGLIPFLLQNKMDTAYMADFIAGFKEAVKPIFAAAFGLFTIGLARSGIAVNIHVLGIQRIKFVLIFYGACAA